MSLLAPSIRNVSTSAALTYNDLALCDATAGPLAPTLPRPVWGLAGIRAKKIDTTANPVTVTATDGALIDGAASYVLAEYPNFVEVVPDGTNWHVVASARVTVPRASAAPVATAGVTQATVTCPVPTQTGGLTITGYRVTPYITGTPLTPTTVGLVSSAVITGLTAGTTYTFTVAAINAAGVGAESPASNAVTPTAAPTIPDAPTVGVATGANTAATANWTAPANNGGAAITGYTVTTYKTSDNSVLFTDTTGAVLTFTRTGLTNGTAVYFKIAATNSVGTGAQSAASNNATPNTSPSDVSGLIGWWRAATIAQADASAVATWADSASTPHNLAQPTVGARPTYRTNVINGLPTVRFNGTQLMATAAFAIPQPATTFLVGKIAAVPGINTYFVDGLVANKQALVATPSAYAIFAGTSVISAGAVTTAFRMLAAIENAPSCKIWVDGGVGVGGNAGTNAYDGVTVGSGGGGVGLLTGDIAEVIVYNRALTLSEINTIGAYLAATYGLTWTTAT